jgi:hypothetical protein
MSFYVANALLQTLAALLLYVLLRTLRPGVASAIFSALISIVAVFVLQGDNRAMAGAQCWPSSGAYRFFWAEAMLALVYLEYRLVDPLKWAPMIYVAGSILWLIGVLWASESAIYCTTIWLPALAFMLYRHTRSPHRTRWGGRAFWFGLPFLMLIAGLGVIEAVYIGRLGHGPDWRAFVDYALSFQGGYMNVKLDLNGCIWLPISIAAGLAIVSWRALRAGPAASAVALLAAAWTLLWSTTSYFLSNSHPNVMQGQVTLYAMVIAVAAHVAARIRLTLPARSLLVACCAPIFIMAPTITIGRGEMIQRWIVQTFRPPLTNVDVTLPEMPTAMDNLLSAGQVGPGDPLTILEINEAPVRRFDNPLHLQGVSPAWLPIEPYSLMAPLNEDRLDVYVRRYLERHRSGGWLVEPVRGVHLSDMYVYKVVQQYCRPVRSYSSGGLKLTYFQYIGPGEFNPNKM